MEKSVGDSILAFPMVAIIHLSSQVLKLGIPQVLDGDDFATSCAWRNLSIHTCHDEVHQFQLGRTLVPCKALHIHCLARGSVADCELGS